MLRDTLIYPVRGSRTEHLFLRGLVLAFAIAGFVRLPAILALATVVPAVLLLGLLGGVYADSMAGHTEPQRIDSLAAVARRGASVGVLATVYLAPAVAAAVVTLVGARSTTATAESLDLLSTTSIVLGSTAVLGIALAAVYLLPIAVGVALKTGSLRSGVAVRSLLDKSRDGAYFTAFGVGIALLLVTVGLAGVLRSFGRLGGALGVVVTFHVLVGTTHLLGRAFGTDGTAAELL